MSRFSGWLCVGVLMVDGIARASAGVAHFAVARARALCLCVSLSLSSCLCAQSAAKRVSRSAKSKGSRGGFFLRALALPSHSLSLYRCRLCCAWTGTVLLHPRPISISRIRDCHPCLLFSRFSHRPPVYASACLLLPSFLSFRHQHPRSLLPSRYSPSKSISVAHTHTHALPLSSFASTEVSSAV